PGRPARESRTAAAGRAAVPRHAAREPGHGAQRPRARRRQAGRGAAPVRPRPLHRAAPARHRHAAGRGRARPLRRAEAAGVPGAHGAARPGGGTARRAHQRTRPGHRAADPALDRAVGAQRARAHAGSRHPSPAGARDRRPHRRRRAGPHHRRRTARPRRRAAAEGDHRAGDGGRVVSRAALKGGERPWLVFLSIVLMAAVVGAFVWWAAASELEEVTRGQGRVVPSSKAQVIQSLDPRERTQILVRDGDSVEKDQPLLRIDDTRATALLRELQAKTHALAAAAARARAEAYGGKPKFPAEARASPELIRRETEAFNARRRALDDSVEALRRGMTLLDREIE